MQEAKAEGARCDPRRAGITAGSRVMPVRRGRALEAAKSSVSLGDEQVISPAEGGLLRGAVCLASKGAACKLLAELGEEASSRRGGE
jgi:hypothetical protein